MHGTQEENTKLAGLVKKKLGQRKKKPFMKESMKIFFYKQLGLKRKPIFHFTKVRSFKKLHKIASPTQTLWECRNFLFVFRFTCCQYSTTSNALLPFLVRFWVRKSTLFSLTYIPTRLRNLEQKLSINPRSVAFCRE